MSEVKAKEVQAQKTHTPKSNTILAKSAQGATFLILLQIGSRALTFLVNQVLLRYLSPDILGVSAQLELFGISTLYFARESLRVALQRQQNHNAEPEPEVHEIRTSEKTLTSVTSHHGLHRRAQEAINLSYIPLALGIPLLYVFANLYLRNAAPQTPAISYNRETLYIYALATFLELLNEPNFAVAQLQLLYGTRALAESLATTTRCLITCMIAVWASRTNLSVSAVPFALGQLSYAVVLNTVYVYKLSPLRYRGVFSLQPKAISQSPRLLFSLFPKPDIILAFNLYAQSAFKHILTIGDTLLIATLTPLSSQGAYALASNYGSLIARILFQPLEESSRSLFGRLLLSNDSPANGATIPESKNSRADSRLNNAVSYLYSLLRFYALLSLVSISLGPPLAPLFLRTLLGARWSSTSATPVLQAYCYYIPLLAVNGIIEAFVSAVATPAQLRSQSAWMMAFSAAFALTGYLVLKVGDGGARGVVLANAVGMTGRIWWGWGFVKTYLTKRGATLRIDEVTPSLGAIIGAIGAASALHFLQSDFTGGWQDLAKWTAVAGAYALILYVSPWPPPPRSSFII